MAEGLRKVFFTDFDMLALESIGNPCKSWAAGESNRIILFPHVSYAFQDQIACPSQAD